jgi:hypothetical protein
MELQKRLKISPVLALSVDIPEMVRPPPTGTCSSLVGDVILTPGGCCLLLVRMYSLSN